MPIPTYIKSFLMLKEQIAIIQRTATTAQANTLLRGANTVERNKLIDSGMPTIDGPLSRPQACFRQHGQLPTVTA
jgi:hypothetical protein